MTLEDEPTMLEGVQCATGEERRRKRRKRKQRKVWVAQLCLTLVLMDCSPASSSDHGILQARIPERVANALLQGFFPTRNWTQVLCTAGGFLTIWAIRESLGKSWGQLLTAPERMSWLRQSGNDTQLWLCLVVKVKSDAVKNSIA